MTCAERCLLILTQKGQLYTMSYSSEGQCPQLVNGQPEDGFVEVVSHPDSKHFLALSTDGQV